MTQPTPSSCISYHAQEIDTQKTSVVGLLGSSKRYLFTMVEGKERRKSMMLGSVN